MLPKPNSQKTEIIFDLIVNGSTHEEVRGYHVFRHYISIIKKKVRLIFKDVAGKKKFGRTRRFRVHILPNTEKKKAICYYKSLFK